MNNGYIIVNKNGLGERERLLCNSCFVFFLLDSVCVLCGLHASPNVNRHLGRVLVGRVVKTAMQKTVTVRCER